MTRPRTPTNVLEARGAFKRHPERRRGQEPEVGEPIGNAPEHLESDAAEAWREIVDQAPEGVLTGADRIWVEITAYLMSEMRSCPQDFTSARMARLQASLGHLGMTPADRSRVGLPTIEPKPTDNPFANL